MDIDKLSSTAGTPEPLTLEMIQKAVEMIKVYQSDSNGELLKGLGFRFDCITRYWVSEYFHLIVSDMEVLYMQPYVFVGYISGLINKRADGY